jgi:hypothetical protein
MKRIWMFRAAKFALIAVAALAALGALVMALWNALLPGLFGWPVLGFWQALGLMLLSRLLLGGWRGGWGHRGGMHGPWGHRWSQMTDEERAKFRDSMRQRFGRGPTVVEPEA